MPTNVRSTHSLLLTLTAVSALGLTAALPAQTPAPSPDSYMQAQPAPIERAPDVTPAIPRRYHPAPAVKTSQPAQGVYVRSSPQASVTTVAAKPDQTELRIDSGLVNISVHHPAPNTTILVDFAGGQLDLVKDGMYTFNTDTRTARVLVGEAQAFPGTDPNAKAIKVKEDHAITFGGPGLHSVEFQLQDARADVLPRDNSANHGDARAPYPAYGFYGGGYPYYGWDYPYYAYDYPYYGWGYPYGFGLGFGFYGGGFYGGHGFGGHGFGGRR